MKPRILVGLSGGVDSAACCRILMNEGYEVSGCFLRFFDDSSPDKAREVAKKLGIDFYVYDRREEFEKKVIRYFVDTYVTARTPNPCARCNRTMKFASLIEKADELSIEYIATGHYAGISLDDTNGRYYVRAGSDAKKDQSYFLWQLTQAQLSRVKTPLAMKEKTDIKAFAADIVPPKTKESNEICFIPNDDYISFIEKKINIVPGSALDGGDFIDINGNVIGHHNGIFRYTIGQRRGLNTALGQRAYVTDIDKFSGNITLGFSDDIYIDKAEAINLNFVGIEPFTGTIKCAVKLRYRAKPVSSTVSVTNGKAVVHMSEKVKKSAPGQSAVFYIGDRLAFGGEIV